MVGQTLDNTVLSLIMKCLSIIGGIGIGIVGVLQFVYKLYDTPIDIMLSIYYM
jgi:uncharacterized membrane protein YuzA (DUF378 family)